MAYERIVMQAEGHEFEGWKSVSVTASWERAVRDFDISVSEVPEFFGNLPWHFPPSTPVQLLASGSLLLNGYVDKYLPSFDAVSHDVRITGRGAGMDFVDCSCNHPTGSFENKTVLQIAQELAAPFGVALKALSSAADAAGRIIPWFQIRRGSSPWAEMMRLLPQIGVTMSGQADGSIALTRAEPQRHSGGLIEGENITAASAILSDAELYSDYSVFGQSPIGTEDQNFEVEGTAGGAGARSRFLETFDEAATDSGRASEHANWLSRRSAGYSRQADITTTGFRDSAGQIWEPGHSVFVHSPLLKIEQDMMIREVTFTQDDAEGTLSHLSLIDERGAGGGGPLSIGSGDPWGVWEGPAGR